MQKKKIRGQKKRNRGKIEKGKGELEDKQRQGENQPFRRAQHSYHFEPGLHVQKLKTKPSKKKETGFMKPREASV